MLNQLDASGVHRELYAVAGDTAGCDDDIARGCARRYWNDDASIAPVCRSRCGGYAVEGYRAAPLSRAKACAADSDRSSDSA